MAGRVYVAGSANMDIVAKAPRLPKPGETVLATALQTLPGGKGANQAVAAARAGAPVTFFGCLGRDAFGDELATFLGGVGMDVAHLQRAATGTGTALIAVDEFGQNQIAVFPGANAALRYCEGFNRASTGDVLLCQNECPIEVVLEYAQAARQRRATVIHNAAPAVTLPHALLEAVDVLVVNDDEARQCLAMFRPGRETPNDAATLAQALRVRADQTIVVTLGADGVVAIDRDRLIRIAAHPVRVVDTTGAGDCFCGYLASCLAAGEPIERAIAVANAAAALAVQRHGAGVGMPGRDEVEAFLRDTALE